MMSTEFVLRAFGTAESQPEAHALHAGPLSADFVDGAIRTLRWHGVEVIRAVDCPIRDHNWSTCPAKNSTDISVDSERFEVVCRRAVADGALDCRLAFSGGSDGEFRASMEITATRNFLINRAGFTVLHPLQGVAGAPPTIVSSDGSTRKTAFPAQISPVQVAFDIQRLRHVVDGIEVEIAFDGEIFEMEDQRNWSDASYKTYCRPLSLPIPYELEAGSTVRQETEIRLSGRPAGNGSAGGSAACQIVLYPTKESFPAVAQETFDVWMSILSSQPSPTPIGCVTRIRIVSAK